MAAGAGANDIAVSAHGELVVSVNGTVVAEPNPVWCSPQAIPALQLPSRVNDPPELIVPAAPFASNCPITTELVAGVKEVTEAAVEPVLLPVEV
jgi:hypothetical protein